MGKNKPYKRLFIVRGLSGSGKTTLGDILAGSKSYAADDFFTNEDGEYNFDKNKLKQAHANCLERVEGAMVAGADTLAVCNTFSRFWEAEPYFAIAKTHGFNAFVVHCENCFGNVHDVPDETVERMAQNWEQFTPQGKQETDLGEQVREFATLQFTDAELSIIMDMTLPALLSKYTKDIDAGRLLAEAEVRRSLLQMAKQGSSPAQNKFMELNAKAKRSNGERNR